jgi:ketosteroid isomerase-like protein
MFAALVRHQYQRGLAALERGDLDDLLRNFNPSCTFVFVGHTPLGARLTSRAALRRWFERFHRLLPHPRFEIRELAISGWPWDVRVAARATIRSTVAGEAYENEFAQFLHLQWGRVVWDYVLEDTQRFEQACSRMVRAGQAEAAAEPIVDAA